MAQLVLSPDQRLQTSIARDGYVFVHGDEMRRAFERCGSLSDWDIFAGSWDSLELDTYMADGGRYRRRRFGVWHAGRPDAGRGGAIERGDHQPHYQGLDYNTLNGGIERWFEPIEPEIGDGATMRTILEYCRALFGRRLEIFAESHGPGARRAVDEKHVVNHSGGDA